MGPLLSRNSNVEGLCGLRLGRWALLGFCCFLASGLCGHITCQGVVLAMDLCSVSDGECFGCDGGCNLVLSQGWETRSVSVGVKTNFACFCHCLRQQYRNL